MQAKPTWPQLLLQSLVLAFVYFGTGRIGLFFSDPTTHVTLVWPATGMAVAAFVRWGWRCWPGVFLGAVWVETSLGYSLLLSSGIAVGNTLAPLQTAQLLGRMKFYERLAQRRDGFKVVVASTLGMMISAGTGAWCLWMAGKLQGTTVWPVFLRWWMGDSGGAMMLTPFLLTWTRSEWLVIGKRGRELVLLCTAIMIVGWFVFFSMPATGSWRPLVFLTLPLVVWGSLRFRPLGGMTVSLVMSVLAALSLRLSIGPFAGFDADDQGFLLWSFIVTNCITAILVGSLQAERESDLAKLLANEEALEMAQSQARIGNWTFDPQRGVRQWSKEMFRLLRCDPAVPPPAYDAIAELIHPDDRALLEANRRRILEKGGPFEFVLRTHPAQGSVRHLNCTVQTVKTGSDGSLRHCGTVQDVTERRLAEQLRAEQSNVIEMIAQGASLESTLEKLALALESQFEDGLCSILLRDENSTCLHLIAGPSLPEVFNKAIDGLEIRPGAENSITTAFRGERVVVEDIETGTLCADFRGIAAEHGLRSYWSMPILDTRNHVLGTFVVYSRTPSRPSTDQLKLIESASNTAAICIERYRAERSIHDSQKRLQVALEASGMGVWEWEIETNSITWSGECYEIVRQYPDPVSFESFIELIHPEDRQRIANAMNDSAAEQKAYAQEFRVTGNDHRERWVAEYGKLGCNPQGKPTRMIGTMQDITRRKQTESALQHSEQRLRAIIENEPECVNVLDGNCCLIEMNPAGLQAFQADSLMEVRSRPLTELIAPEHRDAFLKLHQRIMQGESGRLVFEIIGLKGRRLWMESHAVPLSNAQGKVHALLAVTRDVTERKRSDDAMQHRLALEERLSKLAITVPGVIFSFRLRTDGKVCLPYASPAMEEISGYRADELVEDGSKVFQLLHPSDVERVWDSIFESARSLSAWRQEFRVRSPGKSEIWLEGRATPEREPDGGVLWHGFLHDITLRRQAEIDRQKLVSQLLHSEDVERRRIARELHDTTAQHLAATKLNLTRLIQQSGGLPEEQGQLLGDSLNLIEQAVSEIRTLTYLLHPPLLDELGLVGAIRDYAAGIERRSGIQISVDTEGYQGRLTHETEVVLFRVIQESLTNVLRHSGNFKVLIRLERDETEVRLEVQDSGTTTSGNTKPDTKFLRRMGVGIAAMRERLGHVGGKLTIESDPEGVTVLANVPVTTGHVPVSNGVEEVVS